MPVMVKICGLRDPDTALACAEAGARAIGLVFHPGSPRNLTAATARAIVDALDGAALPVAVCVNMEPETLLRLCQRSGIQWVQLHGSESPATVARLLDAGLRVIKSLRVSGKALPAMAARYALAPALLVECGSGSLPGGNGVAWNWAGARPLAARRPFFLAGGLTPENVGEAIVAANPDGVDVSSGVETAPGVKSLLLVRKFLRAAGAVAPARPLLPVFGLEQPG